MKRPPLSAWLIRYGAFLFFVALAAVFYDPKSGQFGFNAAAKTALISGGVCGGLSILWGCLLGTGARWPLWAARASTGLFLAAFAWRSTVSWTAYFGGAADKWYAATLITLMAVASLALLIAMLRGQIARKPASAQPVSFPTLAS